MDNTKIEWCDATLSLWWGCTKVSDGCKFCYAEHLADGRFGRNNWGPKGKRQEVKSWRSELNKVSKRGLAEGRRLRVFCQSMSDTFEGPETCGGEGSENWQLMSNLRQELLELIPEHPHLDFLLLTKRPENVLRFGRVGYTWTRDGLPRNAWIGTSVEDQATADERIPHLLRIPAAVRFLSCEPLLGPVDLDVPICDICHSADDLKPEHDGMRCVECDGRIAHYGWFEQGIHWVIVGGESGRNARPMHPDWARTLRDQCVAAGVPFFFKQWGEWAPYGDRTGSGVVVTDHSGTWGDNGQFCPGLHESGRQHMQALGKKAAGRLLDGQEWSQFPRVENA